MLRAPKDAQDIYVAKINPSINFSSKSEVKAGSKTLEEGLLSKDEAKGDAEPETKLEVEEKKDSFKD